MGAPVLRSQPLEAREGTNCLEKRGGNLSRPYVTPEQLKKSRKGVVLRRKLAKKSITGTGSLAKGEARDLLAAFSHGVRKGELNSPLMRNRCISRWCLTIL